MVSEHRAHGYGGLPFTSPACLEIYVRAFARASFAKPPPRFYTPSSRWSDALKRSVETLGLAMSVCGWHSSLGKRPDSPENVFFSFNLKVVTYFHSQF